MAVSLNSPLPTKRVREATGVKDYITLYFGPPGVGKTTFVDAFAPTVLFLSTDRGTRTLVALREECETWEDFLTVLKKLKKSDAPSYDIIAIDHVDDWASMAETYVCDKLKVDSLGDKSLGFGKGWKMFKKELENFVREIMAMGSGIVFIAHEDIKTVKTRTAEFDRTMPAMGKSAWKVIVPMADLIGYCGYRTVKKGDDRVSIRVLETIPTEALYVKDRTPRKRPDPEKGYELLDGQAFIASFGATANGKQVTQQQGQGRDEAQGKRIGGRGRRARH